LHVLAVSSVIASEAARRGLVEESYVSQGCAHRVGVSNVRDPAFPDDEEAERSLVHALLERLALAVLVMALLWTALIVVVIDQLTFFP
jgi:hypothetical protein